MTMTASATNGSYTIAVNDTGPGVAETDQAKIFEEFKQSDYRANQGQGWYRAWAVDRKAYCRDARRQAMGRIAPGRGSTFFFHGAVQGREPGGGPADMSKRILVVEDQEDNRQILRDLLGSVGYDMSKPGTAKRAWPPPRNSGLISSHGHPAAAARRLRGDPSHQGRSGLKGIPIIVGHVLRVERRRGQGARRRLRRLCHQAL